MIFSAIKTQENSIDCRLHLEKQFNIKLWSKKTERKTFPFSENLKPMQKTFFGISHQNLPAELLLLFGYTSFGVKIREVLEYLSYPFVIFEIGFVSNIFFIFIYIFSVLFTILGFQLNYLKLLLKPRT